MINNSSQPTELRKSLFQLEESILAFAGICGTDCESRLRDRRFGTLFSKYPRRPGERKSLPLLECVTLESGVQIQMSSSDQGQKLQFVARNSYVTSKRGIYPPKTKFSLIARTCCHLL
ncbi:hypothetical protein AVEN_166748-1 [Araneus ventricosus]|uniref:Uncharacterized protein n=1 Tax=Araneus ventricosus TaxID=182803 RepID=A0A4Y2BN83_ARAVE|nr:hypothetical protein AVEN_166748-1 [Araneus ventricosus]